LFLIYTIVFANRKKSFSLPNISKNTETGYTLGAYCIFGNSVRCGTVAQGTMFDEKILDKKSRDTIT
jgi:hypothetical protein